MQQASCRSSARRSSQNAWVKGRLLALLFFFFTGGLADGVMEMSSFPSLTPSPCSPSREKTGSFLDKDALEAKEEEYKSWVNAKIIIFFVLYNNLVGNHGK